ncbi:MAG: hypothetical protein KDA41_22585, partial [Planctomycetales bacterium]|nr:hypothetical protein [Planctomycetales bacterium]
IGWWVLWRRVAGGLDRGQQLELSNKLAPPLLSGAAFKAARASGGKGKQKKGTKGATDGGINRQELAEMWRTVASLEQMPARSKEGLGDVALRNALAGRGDFAFWALGRLGARVPLYGPAEEVVARDKACGWLDRLLAADWQKHKEIALAVVQLARRCGDDARDIDQTLRARVIDKLTAVDTSAHMVMLVKEVTVLHEDEKAQLFGDTLPSGLRLE